MSALPWQLAFMNRIVCPFRPIAQGCAVRIRIRSVSFVCCFYLGGFKAPRDKCDETITQFDRNPRETNVSIFLHWVCLPGRSHNRRRNQRYRNMDSRARQITWAPADPVRNPPAERNTDECEPHDCKHFVVSVSRARPGANTSPRVLSIGRRSPTPAQRNN